MEKFDMNHNMVIDSAKYVNDMSGKPSAIQASINEQEMSVPLDPANRHYAAILEWAKIDGNTIEDAD